LFDLGYRPGQVGNSVIDGHYDKVDGSPAAFWNIGKLQKGDKLIVTDENGKELTFAVTRLVKYPYDNFPIKEVFGDASVPMLNLITCHGQWNKNTKNYSERMVVYSQLIN
jgi:sortase (surface protein transpeptidase)